MRKHTEETKQKIGKSVRETYQKKVENKKTENILIRNMFLEESVKDKLSEDFSKGHPDNLKPSQVRNYGDLRPV